jgi:hypothetical protein
MDRLSEKEDTKSKRKAKQNELSDRNLLALIKTLYDDYHPLSITNNGFH